MWIFVHDIGVSIDARWIAVIVALVLLRHRLTDFLYRSFELLAELSGTRSGVYGKRGLEF